MASSEQGWKFKGRNTIWKCLKHARIRQPLRENWFIRGVKVKAKSHATGDPSI